MKAQNTTTCNISKENIFKSLVKFKAKYPNRVYLNNEISPDDVNFIRKYCGYDTEIVFFENMRTICPYCYCRMFENGTVGKKPK